jgi:hypothetical protein
MKDSHVDSKCESCESALVQLDGEWFCPECDESDGFHLTPQESDFVL